MRENFITYLDQSQRWRVDCWAKRDDHVWDGIICAEGEPKYPVINGIPRLLHGRWMDECLRQNPAFTRKWREKLDGFLENPLTVDRRFGIAEDIKRATVKSFGEEWQRFDKLLESYQQNHKNYFDPYGASFFSGKCGLDAGCGMGRHVYWAAQYGAEMVAVDLSQAVEVAFQNLKDQPTIHVAQADIYDLPFAPSTFDFVESIGVVHHLPDPEGALCALSRVVKPGGCLFVYLYTKSGHQPTSLLGRIKLFLKEAYRMTGRLLPKEALSYYTLAYALAGRLTFNVPYRVLSRWPALRGRLQGMPLRYYADYPLYVLHTDVYDWVATPLSRLFDRMELQEIFARLSFQRVEYRDNPEWRVFAWK